MEFEVCVACDDIMCGQMVSWRGGVVRFLMTRWGRFQEVPVSPLSTRRTFHTYTHTSVNGCVCDSVTFYFSLSLKVIVDYFTTP